MGQHAGGPTGRTASSTVLLAAAVLALMAGLALIQGGPAAAVQSKPNVLIILTDDQHAESVMPTVMDQTRTWFKDQGSQFTEGYATTPLCCPSRASFMSGRYVHNHGINENDINAAEAHGQSFDEDQSLQSHLRGAGYKTGLFGKFLNAWDLSRVPAHWDKWAMLKGGTHGCEPVPPATTCSPGLEVGEGTFGTSSTVTTYPKYSTTFLREESRDFLLSTEGGGADDTPWFLYVATTVPHLPRDPERKYESSTVPPFANKPNTFYPPTTPAQTTCPKPAEYHIDLPGKPQWVENEANTYQCNGAALDWNNPTRVRANQQGQLRMLRSVDDMVGELMLLLEDLGELEDTLAFFVSDNGFMWGEHWQTRKWKAYTDSVRIPFYARWPNKPAAFDTSGVAANIDLLPTILDAADLAEPSVPLDGVSLLDTGPRRNHLLLESVGGGSTKAPWAGIRTRTYSYIENYVNEDDPLTTRDESRTVLCETGCSGTHVDPAYRGREYYDLVADPWERFNLLADGNPANDPSVPRLHARLYAYRDCAGLSCPPYVDSASPHGVNVQTANGGSSILGKPDNGDTITYSFSEPVEPSSLVTGWDGTATRTESLSINGNAGTTGNDTVTLPAVAALGGTSPSGPGSLDLGRNDYVGAAAIPFPTSTLALSEDFKKLTVTLGGGNVLAIARTATGTMKWRTSTAASDLDGSQGVDENVSETGAADREF